MTCPKCQSEFEGPAAVCPACGVRVLRSVGGLIRTSTVIISSGDQDSFYRSVHDVPEPLRTRLFESTKGDNSGTIVIADRAGKEQLTQILARRETRRMTVERRPAPGPAPAPQRAPGSRRSWLPWIVFVLVLLIADLIAIWLGLHW